MKPSASELYAQIYDITVPAWDGELDFYRQLANETNAKSILEMACGTGRIAIRLAEEGINITGTDLSSEMLDIAQRKSAQLNNIEWLQADMKSIDLGKKFDLIISPGYSFQFMLSPEDQLACLSSIRKHLSPNGTLVIHIDHQDLVWLGGLPESELVFEEAGEVKHPETRLIIRTSWEELGEDGTVINKWERGPVRLHCIFRFEMEHLLLRAASRSKLFMAISAKANYDGQAVK